MNFACAQKLKQTLWIKKV